jgi:ABC-type transport system involved in multi-copper enzyme maturation permease subunit
MSAIALSPTPAARRRPGFGRLAAVELHKMVDTRAGFWLPLGVVAITVITVVITMLTAGADRHTLQHVFGNSLMPSGILLPVIGVLLITSEFSQRTALTTFTLVPRRPRVLAAKVAASLVFTLGAFAVCLLTSVAAVAIGSGGWTLAAAVIPQSLVYLGIAMVTGVAFGLAVLVSAPAIVAYLLLPTVWLALANNIHALRDVAQWLAQSQTLDPMVRHSLSATGWVHLLATVAVWTILPLLIGIWRLLRRDVG